MSLTDDDWCEWIDEVREMSAKWKALAKRYRARIASLEAPVAAYEHPAGVNDERTCTDPTCYCTLPRL